MFDFAPILQRLLHNWCTRAFGVGVANSSTERALGVTAAPERLY